MDHRSSRTSSDERHDRNRALSHLSSGKDVKEFSRKIAKAVLSPSEDIDERFAGEGGEGGVGEDVDVYEVVDRYKQELEDKVRGLDEGKMTLEACTCN